MVLADYMPAIPWILAVIGLLYNNHTANRREKRKEFRSEVDAISASIKDIIKKLEEYYKIPSRDDKSIEMETHIKILFKEIDLKSDRLRKRTFTGTNTHEAKVDCQKQLEFFYDYCTGEFFESQSNNDISAKYSHLHKCYVQGLVLIEAIHHLFLKEFD